MIQNSIHKVFHPKKSTVIGEISLRDEIHLGGGGRGVISVYKKPLQLVHLPPEVKFPPGVVSVQS